MAQNSKKAKRRGSEQGKRSGHIGPAKPSRHIGPAAEDAYEKVGPTSIEGVEATDLPDKGRGDVFSNPSKEAGRRLPQHTGQWGGGDTGLRGNPDIADAKEHGHRKKS